MKKIHKFLKSSLILLIVFSLCSVYLTSCKGNSKEKLSEEVISSKEESGLLFDSSDELFSSENVSYESIDDNISIDSVSDDYSDDIISSESSEESDIIEISEESAVSSDNVFSDNSAVSDDNNNSSEDNGDSSEDVIVSKDPFEPITPIPKNLYPDEIDVFFDKSVFIGYSIMMHFGKYVNQWKIEIDESIMGESIFCCGVGMNFINNRRQSPSKKDNVLPKYQGEAYNFEDLPTATGSNSMYIGLMPFSEFKYCDIETCVEDAAVETINGIENIREKNPELRIVILSGTYNTGTYATGELNPERENNNNVRAFNIKILEYCNDNGIDFIDVSTPLLDGRGFMPVKYASDRDYHIKKNTFKIWVEILRDYAEKKQNGTWKNVDTMPPLVN